MQENRDFNKQGNIELVFEVEGDGSQESVFRRSIGNNKYTFFSSYSHIGIDDDDFWADAGNAYDSWEEFWEEFSDMEDWWFYLKPKTIHRDYRKFVLEELYSETENKTIDGEGGYFYKWEKLCSSKTL